MLLLRLEPQALRPLVTFQSLCHLVHRLRLSPVEPCPRSLRPQATFHLLWDPVLCPWAIPLLPERLCLFLSWHLVVCLRWPLACSEVRALYPVALLKALVPLRLAQSLVFQTDLFLPARPLVVLTDLLSLDQVPCLKPLGHSVPPLSARTDLDQVFKLLVPFQSASPLVVSTNLLAPPLRCLKPLAPLVLPGLLAPYPVVLTDSD